MSEIFGSRGYKTHYKKYDMLAVCSVMFGEIIHPRGGKRILNLVSWLLGEEISLGDFEKAIKFCGPKLIAGQAWAWACKKESFRNLSKDLKKLARTIKNSKELKVAQKNLMAEWLERETKISTKSKSLCPLQGDKVKAQWKKAKNKN